MRYQDFIGELRELIKIGERIRSRKVTHEDPEFRDWRHRTQSLVEEVRAHGYRLPGKFQSDVRTYRAMYPDASRRADAEALDKELGDSLIELRFIVEQYEKFGQADHMQPAALPASPAPSQSSVKLHAPERVTLAWLVKNVSIGFWLRVIAIGIGLLLLGAAIGRTPYFDPTVTWIKANWPF